MAKYGTVSSPYTSDILLKNQNIVSMLHEVALTPNKLQFAISQYIVGHIVELPYKKQLWDIPPS
jgi:hypothetical protein